MANLQVAELSQAKTAIVPGLAGEVRPWGKRDDVAPG